MGRVHKSATQCMVGGTGERQWKFYKAWLRPASPSLIFNGCVVVIVVVVATVVATAATVSS